MAFSERIRQMVRQENDSCAVCRDAVPFGASYDVHSATSLHLVRVETLRGARYLVTSPPRGHEMLKGRTVDVRIWPFDTQTDGIFVCRPCHEDIGRVALVQAKRLYQLGGHAPPPQVLADVTTVAMLFGRLPLFDLAEYRRDRIQFLLARPDLLPMQHMHVETFVRSCSFWESGEETGYFR